MIDINKYLDEGFIHGPTLLNQFINYNDYHGDSILYKINCMMQGIHTEDIAKPLFGPPVKPGDTIYVVYKKDESDLEPDGRTIDNYWDVLDSKVKQISYNEFGTWVVTYDTEVFSTTEDFGSIVFSTYDEALAKANKLNAAENPKL